MTIQLISDPKMLIDGPLPPAPRRVRLRSRSIGAMSFVLGSFGLVAIVVIAFLAYSHRQNTRVFEHGEQTTGVVRKKVVSDGQDGPNHEVTFEFTVNGVKERHTRWVRRADYDSVAVGQPIVVTYDPKNISDSRLFADAGRLRGEERMFMAVGAGVVAVFAAVALGFGFVYGKYRRHLENGQLVSATVTAIPKATPGESGYWCRVEYTFTDADGKKLAHKYWTTDYVCSHLTVGQTVGVLVSGPEIANGAPLPVVTRIVELA